jgi:hypothetical protein
MDNERNAVMFIHGQLWRMFLTYDGVACELAGRPVGVFPSEQMATEAVVQTMQQRHARSVAQRLVTWNKQSA